MKVILNSETYSTEGYDSSGLIPKGVVSAIVRYQDRRVTSVLFMPKSVMEARDMTAILESDKEILAVNQGLGSQERRDAVVGLLKRLASQ